MYVSALALVGAIAAFGCDPNDSGSTSVTCQALAATPAGGSAAWSGSVITIVMENKSASEILGNASAPYINQLAHKNAVAGGYHDAFVHPSEPNYLWMAAGENFGVLDDDDPSAHHLSSTSHIVDQVERAGLTWKAYEEGMGAPCGVSSHGRYAAKHDPFVYFNDVNGWDGKAFHPELRCAQHVVDYSQLAVDLAANALPKYVFITPDLDDDMHDGSIAQGDAWLARELPKLLASPAFTNGGVIFLLWDEGGGTPADDDPPFIAISPNSTSGYVSQIDYDTSAYLKSVETLLGLAPVPCATDPAAVPTMDDLFTRSMAGAPPAAASTATAARTLR
jgi:acid phosphatase